MNASENISLTILVFVLFASFAHTAELSKQPDVHVDSIATMPSKRKEGTTIDPARVREKIQALGLRDDTLEYHEQPLRWLKQHREEILP